MLPLLSCHPGLAQTSADLLARLEADPEQPGEARAQPTSRVMLAIGVQPGVEQRPASRVLDQKSMIAEPPEEGLDILVNNAGLAAEKNGHPCAKPVKFWGWLIERTSKPGWLIYEPFSGSGTTIVAAEHTGRCCRAIEISPAYCDIAVKRWSEFTNRAAVLADDSVTENEYTARFGGEGDHTMRNPRTVESNRPRQILWATNRLCEG